MNLINVHLEINTLYPHLQQIYAGFSELHRTKYLNLTVTRKKEFAFNRPLPYLEATINGFRVIFETHDSWHIPEEIQTNGIDFYFKRSYHRENLKAHHLFQNIYPLGLNYYVTSKSNIGTQNPFINYLGMVKDYRSLINRARGKHQYFVEEFEKYPQPSEQPKILFLARAWDPKGTAKKQDKEERHAINEMRAACIRSLQKNYGSLFIGGFSIDDYSTANYKDCIVSDNSITKKTKYLQTMQNTDICIATTGLHGSIGWKFTEYVAASKAIVSEKLQYEVPGLLVDGSNYLSFETTNECLEKIDLLVKDKNLRLSMMQNNWMYYQNYVSPASLVLNSLITILKKSGN